jgi:hypothetical protein
LRRVSLLVVGALAAIGALVLGPGAGRAPAAGRPAPAWAGTCGLPQVSPIWADYGRPELSSIFGRPGAVLAVSGGSFPAEMRSAGAATIYFDLYLKGRVGEPSAPADPSTIVDKANKLFDFAVQQMGCSTPTIVENELFGAGLVTPWSTTNVQYRQNVLVFLQQLAARGAHPVLLVNSAPYTAGDAGVWWQQVAAVADIVREDYVPATLTARLGPIVGSRALRTTYRRSIADFASLGIAPQRLGIMISFATTRGLGGRNGLQSTTAWLQVAKWQALAARTVAAETSIGSIWSWGWAEWNDPERDPDKPLAACVWLWTRSPSLCDAPGQAGPEFDTSRTQGQIRLPAGIQCTVGRQQVSNDAIQRLQLLTGDRDTAFSAIYERLVESRYAPVSTTSILAAERAAIAAYFDGSRNAYLAALAKAHATVAIARGVLGDQIRRARIAADLPAAQPAATAVSAFYTSYPDVLVRPVETKPVAPWLDGRTRGLILSATAPSQLFEGGTRTVWTPHGLIRVKPLGSSLPLGAVPLTQARPAIVAALRSFARGDSFERWSEKKQTEALATTICARDDLPQAAPIELTNYLPFLQL